MFLRKYEIIFGAPFKIVDQNAATGQSVWNVYKVNGEFVNKVDLDDYLSSNQATFYKIEGDISENKTGLQIEFDIIKGSTTKTNKTSKLTIYNLSDKIVGYLKQNAKNDVVVSIKAGYADDGMKLIFKGTISGLKDKWEGATRKTDIKLTDGNLILGEAFANVSYKKGTKVDTIISDLLDTFGLPKATGQIVKFGDNETIEKPYYYSGLTTSAMEDWCKTYKTNFTVQNGVLVYMPKDGRTNTSVVVISEDSGLVGNIVPENDNFDAMALDTVTKNTSYKFKVLLNGAIVPEGTVQLKTDEYDGVYLKVTDVEHQGSYEDGDWVTIVTGIAVDNIVDPSTAYTR